MRQAEASTSIVTITDRRFLLAVYMLVASLRYHHVKSRITVLTRGVCAEERALLEQFEGVSVVESLATDDRNPCTLKGEAILAAEADEAEYITLLDGDCVVTGDISQYLSSAQAGLCTRQKSPDEIANIYRLRYEVGEKHGTIPRKVLERWRSDVGDKSKPAGERLVASGNLTIHRSCLGFVRKWQAQMLLVLPNLDKGSSHDFSSFAYQQTDESVLNSLLLFASDAPDVYPYVLNSDDNAYVAHLGPYPKYWVMWSKEKLRYLNLVLDIVDWAREQGYRIPKLTWCLKRHNKILAYIVAYVHFLYRRFAGRKRILRRKSSPK